MLSPLPRQVRETKSLVTNPSTSAFPKFRVGRLLQYGFRGLFSVHSRYGLQTRPVALCDPLPRKPRGALLLPPPFKLLPGGAIQFPGGSFFPAVDQRLFTADRKIPITLEQP